MVPSLLGVLDFNTCVAAVQTRATTVKLRACKTLVKMSELWKFVEELNQTVGGERARVAELVNAELVRVRSVVTVALPESESTVSKAMYGVRDGFPV